MQKQNKKGKRKECKNVKSKKKYKKKYKKIFKKAKSSKRVCLIDLSVC